MKKIVLVIVVLLVSFLLVTSISAFQSPVLLWKANVTGTSYEESTPTYSEGVIYVASSNDGQSHEKLFALNAKTGEKIWNFSLPGGTYASPVIDGDRIYIGTSKEHVISDKYMFCINKTTGTEIWNVTIEGGVCESVQFDDNNIYFPGFWNSDTVYALNKTDGSEVWHTTYFMGIGSSASLSLLTEDSLYFLPYNGGISEHLFKIFKINITTGDEIWSISANSYWDNGILRGDDGYLYVSSHGTWITNASGTFLIPATLCSYYENGTERWCYDLNDTCTSYPAYHDGRVFINDDNGSIYCFNALDGTLIWETKIGSSIHVSSPTLSGGLLFIGTEDGHFFALNEKTGTIVYDIDIGAPIHSAPSIVNGVVYFSADDWYMYAYKFGTGGGDWIRSRYDENNTGYSPYGLVDTIVSAPEFNKIGLFLLLSIILTIAIFVKNNERQK